MGTIVTSEITPRVFVADWFVAQNWDALDALGMTHVVSACEIPPIDSSKIAHMHVCIVDLPIADISDHLEKTTKLIRDALAQEGTKLLVCHLLELPYCTKAHAYSCAGVQVHCLGGLSRSISVVCA
jgi:hypothetical protein